jgi:hypothetical protein
MNLSPSFLQLITNIWLRIKFWNNSFFIYISSEKYTFTQKKGTRGAGTGIEPRPAEQQADALLPELLAAFLPCLT